MSVTGLILAGGRGSRMGGVDKGMQLLNGSPMIQQVLARFAPQVDKLIINANRNLPFYRQFGVPVCTDADEDTLPEYSGPLAGLQSGLRCCVTPWLVTTPCDAPLLPSDLVQTLHVALTAANADLAVAVTGAAERRRVQPVFCLLNTALLPHLTAFLQQGGRKMEAWQATLNTVQVHFPDETAFCNINTNEELQGFKMSGARQAIEQGTGTAQKTGRYEHE